MPKGLGRGIDSLFLEGQETKADKRIKKEKKIEESSKKEEQEIDILKIEPNANQPRKNFDEDALEELAQSIKQYGIIQPLVLQKREGYYEIIAGERRWRAAKIAGLKKVPAVIKEYTEQEIVEISLIENIQRENLNPIEEAQTYKRLIKDYKMKQDELAERVSKSRSVITNSMRLLKLSEPVQEMLIEEMISIGHARALLAIENPELQLEYANKIFDEKLSVRDIEKIIKNLQKEDQNKKNKEPIDNTIDYIYRDLEEKVKESLGTKVVIKNKQDGKGKIEIEYYSQEELERITDILRNREA